MGARLSSVSAVVRAKRLATFRRLSSETSTISAKTTKISLPSYKSSRQKRAFRLTSITGSPAISVQLGRPQQS